MVSAPAAGSNWRDLNCLIYLAGTSPSEPPHGPWIVGSPCSGRAWAQTSHCRHLEGLCLWYTVAVTVEPDLGIKQSCCLSLTGHRP